MADITTTDQELEFLLQLGTGQVTYEQALKISNMPEAKSQFFFHPLKRKGLIHSESDCTGTEAYRLNAIVVGWYGL